MPTQIDINLKFIFASYLQGRAFNQKRYKASIRTLKPLLFTVDVTKKGWIPLYPTFELNLTKPKPMKPHLKMQIHQIIL